MDSKTAFGYDFLFVMRTLQMAGSKDKGFDPIADAAARLFMLMWGFSPDEVDSISDTFFEKANKGELGDSEEAFKRLVNHVKKDQAAIERLVIHSAALAYMDYSVTEDEATLINFYQDELDLRPSEHKDLIQKGIELSIGLHFFGKTFAENSNK